MTDKSWNKDMDNISQKQRLVLKPYHDFYFDLFFFPLALNSQSQQIGEKGVQTSRTGGRKKGKGKERKRGKEKQKEKGNKKSVQA